MPQKGVPCHRRCYGKPLQSCYCPSLLTIITALCGVIAAQGTPAAPIPTQILAAKKIFISNLGKDRYSYTTPIFDGGPDRAYNQFYAAMKTLGRFDLTGTPSYADLLFELRSTMPVLYTGNGGYSFDAQFRLVIRDPKSNAILWGVTEHVEWAQLQMNRNKNFDKAMTKLVSDVQALIQPAPVLNGAVTKP